MTKIVGVTGGIGSGKSMVCQILATIGIAIYNADERAKWLINNDLELKYKITSLLGNEAYLPNGNYNRAWVARQVFDQPEKLHQLNAIVHPCVFLDTEAWVKNHQKDNYVVKEAALLTKNAGTNLDVFVVVTSPEDLRIKRIKKRDPQRSEAEIRNIMARQTSDEDFIKMADFVIQNDEKQLLIPQVLALHESLSKR